MTGGDISAFRTLPALLRLQANRRGDASFLHDETGTLTWCGALDLARSMRSGFSKLGIRRGDTVGLMLGNCREFIATWFGLAFGGSIEVPINPGERGRRLAHILNDSGCRELVVAAECVDAVDALAAELSSLERLVVVGAAKSDHFDTIPFDELDVGADDQPDEGVRFSDPEAVMYTSGSTGPAKGAVICHGQHYINGHQPTTLLKIDESDTLYVPLPLYHNMAQGYGVYVSLVSGAAIRLPSRFDADTFWADVRGYEATVLSFVGAMLVLLAKREPRADDRDNSLRVGFGVPIPADLHEAFEHRFGLRLVHGYGSTEATIVAWNARDDRKVGAAGPPLPTFDVAILDEDDVPLPNGVSGQICVRPREPYSMFAEYYRDPERTVEAWRNLWFHTGDRGWLDDDGNLWFVGRLGDVVRRMGEFINAHEVDEALIAHPEVKLAATFGVPSELTEEELMAAIVPMEGAQLDADDIRGWCRDRLPRHAIPRYVEFMKELPMTSTGKIEKYKLRERGVTATTDDVRRKQEATL